MRLKEEATKLAKNIFNFWENLEDKENGGFYGYVDSSLKIDKKYKKGVTLNSRILYFFSEYYLTFKDDKAKELATHAYNFMKEAVDTKYGGVYWSLDYKGNVLENLKHTYNIAFAIYALSYYYEVTKSDEVKDLVMNLFNVIETKCKKSDGNYLEEGNVDFSFKDNDIMSENGVNATYSMNLILHLIEAYTALERFIPSKEVKDALVYVTNLFIDKIYNKEKSRLEVFFDKNWNSLIDLESYGHEIEASWLLLEASEVINDKDLTSKIKAIATSLATYVRNRAYYRPFIINECEKGKKDLTKVWWVEAEAVNGYLYQYSLHHDENDLKLAEDILSAIEEYFVDKRSGSEWFYSLDEHNKPNLERPIVEPWKCPYHNGRMCFEILRKAE